MATRTAGLEHPVAEGTGNLAFENEREDHNEPARNARDGSSSLLQPGEYRDDRNSEIIHSGIIGTTEGTTRIPKRSVHRNALDDLAYPYDEDEDFFVVRVNLGGDQIEELIHNNEIYQARNQKRLYQGGEREVDLLPDALDSDDSAWRSSPTLLEEQRPSATDAT